MNNIRQELEALSPRKRELFELLLKSKSTPGPVSNPKSIPRRKEANHCPLSFAQQRLWFVDRVMPDAHAYNVHLSEHLKGKLNIQIILQAINEIARRHEALRTIFGGVDGQPVQLIQQSIELDLPIVDLSALGGAESIKATRELATYEACLRFDLAMGPLLRSILVRIGSDEHVLLLTLHHAVCDGWSMEVFFGELVALYSRFGNGAESILEELPIQYADFAVWQRESLLNGGALNPLLTYWKKQFTTPVPLLKLPSDRARPQVPSFRGGNQRFSLPSQRTESLRALGRRSDATVFMVVLAAFGALLRRLAGQDEIVLGTPIANRNRGEIQGLIGVFINMLPIRLDMGGNPTFQTLIRRVRAVCLDGYAHEDLPFERLVEELQPERDGSSHPLFQVLIVMQNVSSNILELPGLTLTRVPVETGTSQFDLTLAVEEDGDALAFSFDYSLDLFEHTSIALLIREFDTLLRAVSEDSDQPLSELNFLPGYVRHQLLVEWNDSSAPEAEASLIHALFEENAQSVPHSVALVYEDHQVTNGALNAAANQVAHYLRRCGVTSESRVGIYMERSIDMMVTVLGILKAGGAYTPIDATYPRERIAVILEDAGICVVLTHSATVEGLPESKSGIICLDSAKHLINAESQKNPEKVTIGGNLAYVTYTSGSTGKPNGVAVEHRQVRNYSAGLMKRLRIDPGVSYALVQPLTFDSAGSVVFPWMTGGGTLHVISFERTVNPEALARYFRTRHIDCLKITPSHLAALQEDGGLYNVVPRSRLILGGEASRWKWALRLNESMAGLEVFNHYGPTETTIGVLTFRVATVGLPRSVSVTPLGRPLPNSRIYILDDTDHPVPCGTTGELCIAGSNVSRGYLNRPDLTALRFRPNPFGEEKGARLYRTGDLAKHLADGDVEFLGRADKQVKIRGFRVEMGEIEETIARHPGVKEVLVIAQDDDSGGCKLVAYIVPRERHSSAVKEVRSYLARTVPNHMAPSAFVELNSLPLTSHGKIDRRALPQPDAAKATSETDYLPPQTRAEAIVAAAWQEALGVDRVGVNDNFFDLGGHSLLLVKVHERLKQQLSADISVIDLFRYPTIRAVAAYVNERSNAVAGIEASPSVQREIKTATSSIADRSDIAIIGMAGRFPGAANLEAFWRNLRDGVESISFFSEEEMTSAGIDPKLLHDSRYVPAGAIIGGVELFDAPFFGFSPREAEVTDPQHRLFLECAYEALENAGYGGEHNGQSIGLYAGVSMATYWMNIFSNPDYAQSVSEIQTKIGNDKDHLTTRVSYKLNLKGPSVAVQTTCSSSLVALHFACRSLVNGECDLALAGGVSIALPQREGYLYHEGDIRSPDGHCRAFDEKANGTVSGNGVGLVVLRRLADATNAGDNILAVIKGTAINNDGSSKVGYTAPSVNGQSDVISRALAVAECDPRTISYIEAHGTGTPLGDPIEIAALSQAFRTRTEDKQFSALGSVKTNIGHLDTAAGVAGLIKTVLALGHGLIPPSLNYRAPNPKIDFENSPFFVNDMLRPWNNVPEPRRAGISSFGIGGTNAHAVIEEAPARGLSSPGRPHKLLFLSAKTQTALDAASRDLVAHLAKTPDLNLADVAYTLQVGRSRYAHRRMVVCDSAADAAVALKELDPKVVIDSSPNSGSPNVVFMFPGQGSQYVNMGLELYETEPIYRECLDRCFEQVKALMGFDLKTAIYPQQANFEEAEQLLAQTRITQPALFCFEYAMAVYLCEIGIAPAAMIGHSLGEYVAACLAGVFSAGDALRLVVARAHLMQETQPGAMLSIRLARPAVEELLGRDLFLAAANAPSSCVASGSVERIRRLEEDLISRGVPCRRLRTSYAFHSASMDSILKPFAAEVRRTRINAPTIPFISNLTGTWITPAEAQDPDYWARQLRQTVRFQEGIGHLLEGADPFFIEVGPGQALRTFVTNHPKRRREHETIALLRHGNDKESDSKTFTSAIGRLWLAGAELNWSRYYQQERRFRLALPTYPFERQRYWVERARHPIPAIHPGSRLSKSDISKWLYTPSWKRTARLEDVKLPAGESRSIWVIFADENGLGLRLARRLERDGCEVFVIQPGKTFGQDGRSTLVNPRRKEDYEQCLRNLGLDSATSVNILHLWTFTGSASGEDLESSIDLGFYSLVYLVQALTGRTLNIPVKILVVSNDLQDVVGDENLSRSKATLLGPLKVIPQEYANISCRSIDVGTTSRLDDELVEQLLAEATSTEDDRVAAYRGCYRWVQTFEPMAFPESLQNIQPFRREGVYVITGGLGRIGRVFAEHIALREAGKVVLVGRPASNNGDGNQSTAFGADGISPLGRDPGFLTRIRDRGGFVEQIEADLGNQRQTEAAMNRVYRTHGAIEGVIHAAGLVGRAVLLKDLTRDDCEGHFRAKIRGTLNLRRALAGRDPRFYLLTSSISTVLGGLGLAAYSAANHYMDSFARAESRSSGASWLSVNWDAWRPAGDDVGGDSFRPAVERLAMTSEEGTEVLGRVLCKTRQSQVVVSTAHLGSRLSQWLRLEDPSQLEQPNPARHPGHSRSVARNFVAPGNELEAGIAAIWQELLGVDRVGTLDNFFELGGDSLLGIHLLSRLRLRFHVDLRIQDIFDNPTVASIANTVAAAKADVSDSAQLQIARVSRDGYRVISPGQPTSLPEAMRKGN